MRLSIMLYCITSIANIPSIYLYRKRNRMVTIKVIIEAQILKSSSKFVIFVNLNTCYWNVYPPE